MSQDGTWGRVSVRDSGTGVPPAEHERIWNWFYRVAAAETGRSTATGLGLELAISKTIVEQQHG